MFLILSCQLTVAQDLEISKSPIISDRPGQHTEARTVGRGNFQLESGFKLLKESRYYRKEEEFHFPKIAIRYGLSNRFELRLQGQLQRNQASYYSSAGQHLMDRNSGPGINNIRLGTKFQILNDIKNGNALAVQFESKLPIETDQFRSRFLEPELKLAFRKELSGSFAFLLNVGFDIQDPGGDNIVLALSPIYAFTLQYSRNNFLIFSEVFGQANFGDAYQHCFDFGAAYRFSDNLQLDAYTGFGLSEEAPDFFASVGISFRLPKN